MVKSKLFKDYAIFSGPEYRVKLQIFDSSDALEHNSYYAKHDMSDLIEKYGETNAYKHYNKFSVSILLASEKPKASFSSSGKQLYYGSDFQKAMEYIKKYSEIKDTPERYKKYLDLESWFKPLWDEYWEKNKHRPSREEERNLSLQRERQRIEDLRNNFIK